jgi:hypothetical protein
MAQQGQRPRRWLRTIVKIVALIVVILAVGVGAFVLVGRIEVGTQIRAIRAKGELVSLSDLKLPSVPDSRNAFPVYRRAVSVLVDETTFAKRQAGLGEREWAAPTPEESSRFDATWDRLDSAIKRTSAAPPAGWSSEDIALVRSFVDADAEALRLVRQAARMPAYRSDTDWRYRDASWMRRLSKYREFARQLKYKARIDLVDGKVGEAAETCVDALRMASHVGSEPDLICFLVETGCRAIALSELEQVVAATREPEELRHIMRLLDETRPRTSLKSDLVYSRARDIRMYDDLRVGTYPKEEYLSGVACPAWAKRQPLYSWLLYYDEAAFLQAAADYVDLSDKSYHEIGDELQQIKSRKYHLPWGWPMLLVAAEAVYEHPLQTAAAARMRHEVLETAVAIKLYHAKHGEYPESLSDLTPDILPKVPVDEFTGKPLIYGRKGASFVVYSVGRDLTDDGGMKQKVVGTEVHADIVYEEQ